MQMTVRIAPGGASNTPPVDIGKCGGHKVTSAFKIKSLGAFVVAQVSNLGTEMQTCLRFKEQ